MSEQVLTLTTVDALEVQLVRAGIGGRTYAFVIDWHIRVLAALAWYVVVAIVLGFGFKESPAGHVYTAILPATLIYVLYHPVLEVAMQGQTPGKRWTHLRVVTTQGQPPSAGAHLVRNVFRILDSLPMFYAVGLITMMFSRNQVRLGDYAAGTLVVYDAPPEDLSRAAIHERVSPAVAQLLEEWLARWNELEPPQRDTIARTLLAKAGDPTVVEGARQLDSVALRDFVRGVLDAGAPGA